MSLLANLQVRPSRTIQNPAQNPKILLSQEKAITMPVYFSIQMEGDNKLMPMIDIQENASFDVALRRFKRACEKAGIPTKLRQIEHYEKPTTKRKRKRAAAVKRYAKKLQKEQEALERERTRH